MFSMPYAFGGMSGPMWKIWWISTKSQNPVSIKTLLLVVYTINLDWLMKLLVMVKKGLRSQTYQTPGRVRKCVCVCVWEREREREREGPAEVNENVLELLLLLLSRASRKSWLKSKQLSCFFILAREQLVLSDGAENFPEDWLFGFKFIATKNRLSSESFYNTSRFQCYDKWRTNL